ncbi:MAG: hypothetical protein ACLFVU_14960 [Phycisphaerae bacterium]
MKRLITLTLLTASLVAMTGCLPRNGGDQELSGIPTPTLSDSNNSASQPAGPQPEEKISYLARTSVDAGNQAGNPSAVEDALRWARKYKETAEKLLSAQERLRKLEGTNRTLEGRLTQTEKELADANSTLFKQQNEMRKVQAELKQWKSNVLGYQSEMKKAMAQIAEAQADILIILNGDVPKKVAKGQ